MSRSRLFAGFFTLICSVAAAAASPINETVLVPQPVLSDSPKVISTLPEAGQTIEPGEATFSVTFDQPMQDKSYSLVTSDEGASPVWRGPWTLSPDARTYTWHGTVAPNQQYVFWLNRPPYMNFKGAESGRPATPFQLHFSTRP
jgi:hypothetical protein